MSKQRGGSAGKSCSESMLDRQALDFARIYVETRKGLIRYLSSYFRRSQEVEDVVQEAFVKVMEAQRDREIQSPKAYLYRTARNLALKEVGSSRYKLVDLMGDILPESDLLITKTMEEQFETRENFGVFCRAVRSLPLKCRRAYVLCRVYGFTHKEVATYMGVTKKAVEVHLTRATRRCAEFIEAEQRITEDARSGGRRHG